MNGPSPAAADPSAAFWLADDAATHQMGAWLAAHCTQAGCVWLVGDLGAGKTALARAWLRALGVTDAIKSPTYPLVECYEPPHSPVPVYHLDLYRLQHPDELEDLGLRDWLAAGALLLVEWPERGQGLLPTGDLVLALSFAPTESREPPGRQLFLSGPWAAALPALTAPVPSHPPEEFPDGLGH